MAEYAPEYSQANQAKLVEGYNALQNPAAEKAKRQLAQSLAGTAGMYGGARSAGLGNIAAQQLANTGQYAQNLAQTGLEAGRGERLTAEGRAYEDPYRQAALTGQFQGQNTLAGTQSKLAEAATTGQYGGQDTLAKTLAGQQYGLQSAQVYGTGEGGKQTAAYQQQLMPWLTQGYLSGTAGQGTGPGGYNLSTEQQLQEQSPENKFAQSLGLPNGISLSTLATSDPGAFQQLIKTGKLPSDYAGGMYGSKAAAPSRGGGGKF